MQKTVLGKHRNNLTKKQVIPEDYACFSLCYAATKNYSPKKSDCTDHPAVIGGHGNGW
jgi:hypothetical protein